jgi:hypothetical protein
MEGKETIHTIPACEPQMLHPVLNPDRCGTRRFALEADHQKQECRKLTLSSREKKPW